MNVPGWLEGRNNPSYPRTSSYHRTTYPLAAYGDGYLYVMGNNATEPDVMYFRSTQYPQPAADPEPTPGVTPSATGSQSSSSRAKGSGAKTKAKGLASRLPKTGDSAQCGASALLAILGAGSIACATRMRKREGQKSPF